MEFSTTEFRAGFISETNEHLDSLNDNLIKLKNSPKEKQYFIQILRELHTVKGTARLMNFLTIEKLAHGLEDVYKGIQDEKYELTDHIVKLTFATSDCIKRCLAKITESQNDNIDIQSFMKAFADASSGMFFTTDALEAENKGYSIVSEDTTDFDDNSLDKIKSIRIDIDRINDIIGFFDNIIIKQFRFKHQLEDFEKKSCELPRQLKEELNIIETSIFETKNSILNLRMLPLNIILSPLKKEIEENALYLNKDIILDIPQTDIMLDKAILETLKDIILHLVRNSLDHGIEPPEERLKLNKNPRGKISISTQQISSQIIITVSDDGRGIQYDSIRKKACMLFPNQALEISSMTDKELQQYLYMSGFSTKDDSSLISGRGIGLDVVRTDMEHIKGKIRINSTEGKGTTFELYIPLTLATQQGLFIYCGQKKYMIPSHYIQEILDTRPEDFIIMQSQTFIRYADLMVPVYFLSSILGDEVKQPENNSVILVEYLETHIAIMVDSIYRHENVVVNTLPPLLKHLKPLQGVVYDENYSIIPILNIPDIMSRMKNLYMYDLKKHKTKNEKKSYTILVVDDSTTTRQIEETILETDGYIVESSSDGILALETLKKKHIDLIISDIKMPRMDGLTLLNNVRRMEEYAATPFIIVSGVYDSDLKKQFIENGAQDFIVKSDFKRGNLLEVVREHLYG